MKCGKRCEIYSRVVGYHRPIQNWNIGKKSEWEDRVEFTEKESDEHRLDYGSKQS